MNFNLRPYWDDYDPNKQFYRVLFRPGLAVQARELTQLQTILQNQIAQFGNNIFKQGAMVVPGQVTLDLKLNYVKLKSTFGGADLSEQALQHLVYSLNGNKEIIGLDSGVRARVLSFQDADASNPPTIFVQYRNSGTTQINRVFTDNEDIKVDGDGGPSVKAFTTQATGLGSGANITQGIYFINGFFALVQQQSIILDPYNNLPSYRIGLQVVETLVTPEADTSLLDNAQGSSNFAAPGAHRYQITLNLIKLAPTSTLDNNFIELMVVNDGNITFRVDKTEYAQLEKTLARRTFDQAGNYAVRPFLYDVREHRNNNRGAWKQTTVYQAGDIVQNSHGLLYQAEVGGTSSTLGPTVAQGTQTDGTVKWFQTNTPNYNQGVFPAEEDGGQGEVDKIAFGIEPGKAYVEGFEIEKIATEFIGVNKARDFDRIFDGHVNTTLGNFCRIVKVFGLPNIEKFPKVNLYQKENSLGSGTAFASIAAAEVVLGSPIGTANIRAIEPESVGALGTQFICELINIQMAGGFTFSHDVKAMAYDTGKPFIFTADLFLDFVDVSGLISTVNSGPNTNITGSGTSFTSQLAVGDYIFTGVDTFGIPQVFRITTVTDDVTAVAAGNMGTNTTIPFKNTEAPIFEPDGLGATFKFPHGPIRSIRSSDDTTLAMRYTVWRESNLTAIAGAPDHVDVTVVNSGETIGNPALENSYTIARDSSGAILNSGITITQLSSTSTRLSGTGIVAGETYTIIYPVNKAVAAAQENSKTPHVLQTQDYGYGGALGTGDGAESRATARNIYFKQADIYKFIGIFMKSGFTAISGSDQLIDITDRYVYDDGQRPDRYDIAKLTLIEGEHVPTGTVRLVFQTWTHGINRDYFSVDSYVGSVDYSLIPQILPQNDNARDYIDFRPTMQWADAFVNLTAPGSGYVNSTDVPTTGGTGTGLTVDITQSGGAVVTAVVNEPGDGYTVGDVLTITTGGANATVTVVTVGGSIFSPTASYPEQPRRGIDFEADYSYYLARKFNVAIDPDGNYFASIGASAVVPVNPQDSSNGMTLFKVTEVAYTFDVEPQHVQVQVVDNKRYTMRDIGNLEKRIDNLEYYTALSALELETKNKEIMDGFGLNRPKTGFVVDAFNGHGIGDSSNPDYHAAIDMEHNECRPQFSMTNISLIEQNTLNINRQANFYQITGDLITNRYNPVAFITQPYASDFEPVNPFAVTAYSGHVEINPSSDDWFDEKARPDVIQNPDGNFDSVVNAPDLHGFRDGIGSMSGIWNAWQTQWSGSPEQKILNQIPNDVINATNDIGARVNLYSLLVPRITKQLYNDKMLAQALVPFMRGFSFVFTATGMKPNTRMFPFFDKFPLDGTEFIAPAIKIKVELNDPTVPFDFKTSAGWRARETARTDAFDNSGAARALPCFNHGDVITGESSGSTAVVLYGFNDPTDNNNYYIYVMNIKGNFNTNESVSGSISGAIGTLVGTLLTGDIIAPGYNIGQPIFSDGGGNVVGVITVLDNPAVVFKTGIRELRISDSPVSYGNYTTFCKKQIRAQGLLETKNSNILSTRPIDVANTFLTEAKNVTSERVFQSSNTLVTQDSSIASLSNINTPFQPPVGTQTDPLPSTPNTFVLTTFGVEPLAQTFRVNSTGGAFLTAIDLYFVSKDTNVPVTLEIREMINGYPGLKVLPFSKTSLVPNSVNVSTDASVPTTFTFYSPVYVQDGTEYAITITADSNNYILYTGVMGEQMINSTRTISKQPLAGGLFSAQNSTTRILDVTTDLKFTLYRAQFNTNELGTVPFVNSIVPKDNLEPNPFLTVAASNIVRVTDVNHGLRNGDHVQFNNVPIFNGFLDANDLNREFAVANVLEDSYTINIVSHLDGVTPVLAGQNGPGGGTGVFVTKNVAYDAMQLQAQVLNFSDTSLTWQFQTLDGETDAIDANDTFIFGDQKLIYSPTNEKVFNKQWSALLTASMATKNDAVSPVIDIARMSMIAIRNRINVPTLADNNSLFDDQVIFFDDLSGGDNDFPVSDPRVSFVNIAPDALNALTFTDPIVKATIFRNLTAGKYITVTGATAPNNNGTYLVASVAPDGSQVNVFQHLTTEGPDSGVKIVVHNGYVDETSVSGGTSLAKYITKRINLTDNCSFIKVEFEANIPIGAVINTYWRAGQSASWGSGNSSHFNFAPTDVPEPTHNSPDIFDTIEVSIPVGYTFNTMQIKLVMTGFNDATVPRIKDFRVTACV